MGTGILKENIFAAAAFAALNALMLAGMSLFSKLLAAHFGPIEITFLRNAVSLVALGAMLVMFEQLSTLKTSRPWAHLIRSSIGTVGIVCGNWALSIMPLAETTVLLFTAPLFVVLMSYPVLKEPVGPFRIAAVICGFAGVVVMAAPEGGQGLPWLGIVMGLLWGFTAGGVDISLRWLGSTENSSTTTFYFLLFGVLATGLYWPFSETEVTLSTLTPGIIVPVLGIGLTGFISLMAKTQSYRLAPAALVAPVTFTMIVWTGLFDYLFWGKIPAWNVVAGAVIIIASNLFILWREHVKRKRTSVEQSATAAANSC